VGERLDVPASRFGAGAKVGIAAAVAAVVVGGYTFFGRGDKDAASTAPTPAATATAPTPAATATATTAASSAPAPAPTLGPAATPKPAAAPLPLPAATAVAAKEPKPVTLRVTSEPVGAKVTDDEKGTSLGVTPLVLTRPRGGSLKLRLEKDGFGANTRTVSLDGDQSVAATLEHAKPKPRPHRPHEPRESNEPAKL
jgi:hypothetical protein